MCVITFLNNMQHCAIAAQQRAFVTSLRPSG